MRDDLRIHERLASKGWDTLRPIFEKMHSTMLAIDDDVAAELTTIYVKYKYTVDPLSRVFAVIWLKNTKCIDVGLTLPEKAIDDKVMHQHSGLHYPPLNAFITLRPGESVPDKFGEWARIAYEYRKTLD